MRDYHAELASTRFWDRGVEGAFEEHGEALVDCALQCREEVEALCQLIEAKNVRSFLEIGVWTGGLGSALHGLFQFDRLAACDHGWAERWGLSISLPPGADFYRGDSDSAGFLEWREALGPIDLVFIDANHRYRAVKRDFEINRTFPHRFLAFHDITGARPGTEGVAQLWRELEGFKMEIVKPHAELGLERSLMGIGIWSATEDPRALISSA